VGAARLILIEGMIGSGKTTTAMRVGDWLARRGENLGGSAAPTAEFRVTLCDTLTITVQP
jgi:nucleoside-triphosphatase THEP1